MCRAGSSRWCPTREQLMILKELYRSGIRTPSVSQIQYITALLSSYGRIEGKNVFYWFQNHKTRDRQKSRRKLNKQLQLQKQVFQVHHCQMNQNKCHHFGFPTDKFSFNNSSSLLFQGEAADAPEYATHCKGWSVHNSQSLLELTQITSSNYDWTLVGVNQASSRCTRPLKTLDLFPASNKLED